MIGVALEQLTPALKLDADWIGLLGAGTLAGLFVGTSLFGYISDKVGRRKMFLIDIIAIGVISVATMFVSSPVELLVMRVLIGIVIGADYPIATSMITEFSSTRQRAFSISFIAAMWYVGATCWRSTAKKRAAILTSRLSNPLRVKTDRSAICA